MATKKKIELGRLCKDAVTGFVGVAIGVTQWITGCTRWGLQPQKLDKDGKVRDPEWFDGDRLSVIGTGVNVKVNNPGGPMPAPRRQKDPR
jgi:hypothetical protein